VCVCRYEVESFEELAGAEARKVILFLAVMAAHALGEGSGVGVSFAGQRGWAQGTLVTLAIGLHNVPEGLAVATVMAAKGASPRRALLWATLTAAPQVGGQGPERGQGSALLHALLVWQLHSHASSGCKDSHRQDSHRQDSHRQDRTHSPRLGHVLHTPAHHLLRR
jgi:hypothetical protein